MTRNLPHRAASGKKHQGRKSSHLGGAYCVQRADTDAPLDQGSPPLLCLGHHQILQACFGHNRYEALAHHKIYISDVQLPYRDSAPGGEHQYEAWTATAHLDPHGPLQDSGIWHIASTPWHLGGHKRPLHTLNIRILSWVYFALLQSTAGLPSFGKNTLAAQCVPFWHNSNHANQASQAGKTVSYADGAGHHLLENHLLTTFPVTHQPDLLVAQLASKM